MTTTRNQIQMGGFPQAKRVWLTMELENGEHMMINGAILNTQIDVETDFDELRNGFEMLARHVVRQRRTRLTIDFSDGFTLTKTDAPVTIQNQSPGAKTETVESKELDPEALRRFRLE